MKTIYYSIGRAVPAKFLFIAASLFCFAVSGYANIYYVSTTGSDISGNGSAVKPWRTLFKATSSLSSPGDTIHINAGTYVETQQCLLSPGVSIEGAGSSTIIQSTLSGTFQEIISLRSNTEGTNGRQSISYIKMDGNNLTTSWGICVAARSNVSIHHCEFINFRETAVNFSGIAAATGATAPVVYATGNSFYSNIVTNCSSNTVLFGTKYGKGNLQFGGQKGFLCYSNEINQPQRVSTNNDDIGWPIKMANEGHIKDCKVYNNVLKRAPIAASHGVNENWNFSFEMWNIEGGLEFYNNTLQGEVDIVNCTKGKPADGYTFGMKFYNNISSLPALSTFLAYALRLETNESDIEINGNTFSNLNGAIVLSPHDYNNNGFGIDVHRINIHNNLFKNMGKIGGGDIVVNVDNIDVAPQCYFDDFYFYNNTVIAAPGADAPFFALRIPSYNGGNTRRIYIRNNIIQGFSVNPMVCNPAANADSVFIEKNGFYNNASNTVMLANGTPLHYANNANSTINPLLDASYKPMTGSPMIDAGAFVGLPYSGAAPDKGYAEINAGALPVKLIEFTAAADKSVNILQWKTAVEINSNHFIIERSANGRDYTAIGTTGATGVSSTVQTYNFTDISPLAGINYYRLAIVDKDNSKDYSNIVFIKPGADNSLTIVNAKLSFFSKSIAVTVTAKENQKALLNVIDNTGRVLFNEAVMLQKGTNFLDRSINPAAQGIYYVRLQTAGEATVKNIVSNN